MFYGIAHLFVVVLQDVSPFTSLNKRGQVCIKAGYTGYRDKFAQR